MKLLFAAIGILIIMPLILKNKINSEKRLLIDQIVAFLVVGIIIIVCLIE